MADRLTAHSLLLCKVEPSVGTDAVPTPTADTISLSEPTRPRVEFGVTSPRPRLVRGSYRSAWKPLLPQGRHGTLAGKVAVRGTRDGAAYAAAKLPELDAIYQACGLAGTLTSTPGTEKVAYRPAHTGLKSLSAYHYEDGKLRKLLGARGNFTLGWKAGAPAEVEFELQGLYQTPTDVAVPTTGVFGTSEPFPLYQVAFALGAYAAGIIREFSFSTGNEVQRRPSANAVGGFAPPRLGALAATFRVVLEDPLVSEADLESFHVARSSQAISWFNGNSSLYNRLRFAGNAIIESYELSDDGGVPIATISGGLYDSDYAANDAFVLTHE